MSHTNATHHMTLTSTHPSGAEEWTCSECGRTFVMQVTPNLKRVILAEGDMHVQHATSRGGLQIGAPRLTSTVPDEVAVTDEQLDVWLDHVNRIDIDGALGDMSQ